MFTPLSRWIPLLLLVAFALVLLLPSEIRGSKEFRTVVRNSRTSIGVNKAIAIAESAGGGTVLLPCGTYFAQHEAFRPRPDVRLVGEGPCTILTQASGSNLPHIVNAAFFSPSNGGILNVAIDGNGHNQTSGTSLLLIGGTTTNFIVHGVTFRNAPGNAILVHENTGTANIISGNQFSGVCVRPHCTGASAIEVANSSTRSHYLRIENNDFSDWHTFAVSLQRSDYFTVQANRFNASSVVARVNTYGTSVVRTTGDSFQGLRPNHICRIAASGQNYNVLRVLSEEELTLNRSVGYRSDVLMSCGDLEAILVNQSSRGVILDNQIFRTADAGITVWTGKTATSNSAENQILSNRICGNAASGIILIAEGDRFVNYNQLLFNYICNNGRGQEALSYSPSGGISHSFLGTEHNLGRGNVITDDQSPPTQEYCIVMNSPLGPGNMAVDNDCRGNMNDGIFNLHLALAP